MTDKITKRTPPTTEETYLGKRRKLEDTRAESNNAACEGCGGKKFLDLTSRGCDNNYMTLPCGKTIEGYCPVFQGVCDSDGAMIRVCISCGKLYGFDSTRFRTQLNRYYRGCVENGMASEDEEGEEGTSDDGGTEDYQT